MNIYSPIDIHTGSDTTLGSSVREIYLSDSFYRRLDLASFIHLSVDINKNINIPSYLRFAGSLYVPRIVFECMVMVNPELAESSTGGTEVIRWSHHMVYPDDTLVDTIIDHGRVSKIHNIDEFYVRRDKFLGKESEPEPHQILI